MSGPKKWDVEFIFKAYDLAKVGSSEYKIAAALGVERQTVRNWRKMHPLFDKAIKIGKRTSQAGGTNTFIDYVYGMLPKELKSVWDEMQSYGENLSRSKIEALLWDKGKRFRQHLFIHALVHCNFNASEACRKVGITYDALQKWQEKDPIFTDLLTEVHIHKKNFFEGALINLIANGDTSATIFANKTINRDRGYSDKLRPWLLPTSLSRWKPPTTSWTPRLSTETRSNPQ
jgi:hypothetical protein